jgi:hypothetical protein
MGFESEIVRRGSRDQTVVRTRGRLCTHVYTYSDDACTHSLVTSHPGLTNTTWLLKFRSILRGTFAFNLELKAYRKR